MLVGNPSVIAIETHIEQPYEKLSQRALGFFVIHIGGQIYGIRSSDATLLANSFDSVSRRIVRRGLHCFAPNAEANAFRIVDAVCAALYDDTRQGESFFSVSAEQIRKSLNSNEVIWAPDGDAAFDDGSHVLQFDINNKVRLIAFKNSVNSIEMLNTVSEAWIDSDEFYALLDEWKIKFEEEWLKALKMRM